jgi:hypothetical protein
MAQSSGTRSPRRRKSRTREHIIAELSLHHLSGLVLRAGFTIEAHHADYGIDAHIETFDADGAVENGLIFAQLKVTDNIEAYRLENADLSFPMEKRDLDYWAKEPYPAYLVLYDAQGMLHTGCTFKITSRRKGSKGYGDKRIVVSAHPEGADRPGRNSRSMATT